MPITLEIALDVPGLVNYNTTKAYEILEMSEFEYGVDKFSIPIQSAHLSREQLLHRAR